VRDVVIGTTSCLLVTVKNTVKDAFKLMIDNLVAGVGVVDKKGVLVGGISIRAIHCINDIGSLEDFFNLTVGDFLKKELVEDSKPNVLAVRDTSPLAEAIKKLSVCKVYRVFIVDAEGKPQGIVSFADVLRYISNIDAARDQKLQKQQEKEELAHYKAIYTVPDSTSISSFSEGVTLPYPIGSKHLGRKGSEYYSAGWASMQGWRATMEDVHIVILDIEQHPTCAIFGVFDGHGGRDAAQFLGDHFGERLVALEDMFDEEALTKLCTDLDDEYLQEVGADAQKNYGSTAVVSITKKLDNGNYKVLNLNVGDSRSVIGKKDPKTGTYETICCTVDQNGHSRTERKRVRECGGWLSSNDKRVDGMLSVTRAFGDPWFKVPWDAPPDQKKVIAVPTFTLFEVTSEDFLFLSCDGIYEAPRKEQAFKRSTLVEWLGKQIETTPNLGVVCGHTLNECLARGSTDNMSAILVRFKDDPQMLDTCKFFPGPPKIPKKHKPPPEAQRIYQKAYIENSLEAGYTLEEAIELRKKLGPNNFI